MILGENRQFIRTSLSAGVSAFLLILSMAVPVSALEGRTVAGPIGGTDMRSAQLPPPGLYGVLAAAYGELRRFRDDDGDHVPALADLQANNIVAAAALLYVPDL